MIATELSHSDVKKIPAGGPEMRTSIWIAVYSAEYQATRNVAEAVCAANSAVQGLNDVIEQDAEKG